MKARNMKMNAAENAKTGMKIVRTAEINTADREVTTIEVEDTEIGTAEKSMAA